MIGIEDSVRISPPGWPSRAAIPPGDLTKYAPVGLGLKPPMVMMPWDSLEGMLSRGSFYGATERTGDPFRDAPVNDAAGGTIYFGSNPEPGRLAAVFDLLRVNRAVENYAVFAAESANPQQDRYLAQIRIVMFGAMKLFQAEPDPDDEPWTQPLSIGALIDAFIAAQQTAWGDGASGRLEGSLGGDGDWARETLSFGFMVENASNGIYRLWSRPWLVTK